MWERVMCDTKRVKNVWNLRGGKFKDSRCEGLIARCVACPEAHPLFTMLLITTRRLVACSFPRAQANRILRCFSVSRPLHQDPHFAQPYQNHNQQNQQFQQNQQNTQEIVEPVVHGKPDLTQDVEMVFEITEKNMESAIMEKIPLIIDVYSHDELNSKAQSDKLIEAAKNSNGLIRVGRLNANRFPGLLANMNLTVDLLPATMFVYGGRQFGQFFGKGDVIEDAELDKKITILYKVAGIYNSKALLKSAEGSLAQGDIEAAKKIYVEVLHDKQLKMEAAAMAGLAMCALQSKNIEEAQELIDVIKKNHKDDLESPYVKKAVAALELAKTSGTISEDELKERLKANPENLEAKYALAVLYSTTNKPEQAIEEALGIIKIDKQHNEQAARKLLLQVFEMLGSEHPATVRGRKRLSSLWFL